MIAQGTLIERLVAFGCGDEQEMAVCIRDVADRFNLEYTVVDHGEGVTSYWTSADAGVIQDEIEAGASTPMRIKAGLLEDAARCNKRAGLSLQEAEDNPSHAAEFCDIASTYLKMAEGYMGMAELVRD